MSSATFFSRRTIAASVIAWFAAFLLFGCVYRALNVWNSEPMLVHAHGASTGKNVTDFVACLYFSAVTQATIGYGDIVPASDLAKAVTIVHALLSALFLAALGGLVGGHIVLSCLEQKERRDVQAPQISIVKTPANRR